MLSRKPVPGDTASSSAYIPHPRQTAGVPQFPSLKAIALLPTVMLLSMAFSASAAHPPLPCSYLPLLCPLVSPIAHVVSSYPWLLLLSGTIVSLGCLSFCFTFQHSDWVPELLSSLVHICEAEFFPLATSYMTAIGSESTPGPTDVSRVLRSLGLNPISPQGRECLLQPPSMEGGIDMAGIQSSMGGSVYTLIWYFIKITKIYQF